MKYIIFMAILIQMAGCAHSQNVEPFMITNDCLGELCIGASLNELSTNPHIRIRKAEYQYPNGTYIDSVVFIEQVLNDTVLAYSRIPIIELTESFRISFIVTESDRMKFENGIGVGMSFAKLQEHVPTAEFSRESYETRGMGQIFDRIKTGEDEWNMYCITYEEVGDELKMDTVVTSISMNKNR